MQNFKNLNQGFNFSDSVNVLIRQNGWGKTNLLEAIDYIEHSKSFRSIKDIDLINWNNSSNQFKISAEFANLNIWNLDIVLTKNDEGVLSKRYIIDGKPVQSKKVRDKISTFFYSPHLDDLVSSTPEIRRKMFDRILVSLNEDYYKLLNEYKFVVRSRNKLLKQKKEEKELFYWNTRLIESGTQIMEKRISFLQTIDKYLKKIAKEVYKDMCKSFRLNYESKSFVNNKIILDIKQKEGLLKELEAGMSLYGPHRDNFVFYLNGYDLRYFGSRAQQRLAGLILYFALIDYLKDKKDKTAVILFDDILSELDDNYRKYVQNFLLKTNYQIILTASSRKVFSSGFLDKVNLI